MPNLQSISKSKVIRINLVNIIASSALITAAWTALSAFEIYRETLLTTYHIHSNLQSHIHSSALGGLNDHLYGISKSLQRDGISTAPNVIFIINKSGKITGSSVKAWQGSNIMDTQFATGIFDNDKINMLRNCIANASECNSGLLESSPFSSSSIVFIRDLRLAHKDVGMKTETGYLMFVFNYSDAYSELTISVVVGFILISILVILISILPATYMIHKLLPFVYTSLQKDCLTGLSNRAIFTEQAIVNLEDAEISQESYVLAIMDIDDFKRINDTLGHQAGDITLTEYGLIIDQAIREDSDLSSRFGGEEFSLLVKCSRTAANTILERLRLQIEIHDIRFKDTNISTTVSIGAASTSECGYNLDYLIMKADDALYRAKSEGKNQIQWHDNVLT